jgi:hypothetical protein
VRSSVSNTCDKVGLVATCSNSQSHWRQSELPAGSKNQKNLRFCRERKREKFVVQEMRSIPLGISVTSTSTSINNSRTSSCLNNNLNFKKPLNPSFPSRVPRSSHEFSFFSSPSKSGTQICFFFFVPICMCLYAKSLKRFLFVPLNYVPVDLKHRYNYWVFCGF